MSPWTFLAVVTGFRLHWVGQVLPWVGCLSVLLGASALWWKTSGTTRSPFGSLLDISGSPSLGGLAALHERLIKIDIGVLALALILLTHAFWREFDRPEVVSLTNVHVLARSDSDSLSFIMDVWDPATRVRHSFTATFCPNSQLTPEIQPGVTLTLLNYLEDIHQRCFDVRAPGTGYILERDQYHAPVIRLTEVMGSGSSSAR